MNNNPNKCKVLMVVNGMTMGGIENFLMNIVRNIDRSKFYIEFLYCDTKDGYFDKELTEREIKYTKITSRSAGFKKHLKELKEFFKINEFDAVHINYSNALCITVARAAKKAGVKNIIVHSHNSKSSAKVQKIHNLVKNFLPLYANKFCACSQVAAEWMFSKRICRSGKVQIVKNAIDVEKFCFKPAYRDEIKMEFNIEDKVVIGHIGRFIEQKNHKFLIDIFERYHSKNEESVMLLLGDGGLMAETVEYVKSRGLESSVIFAGVRDDIPRLLSAMDAFVMPSLFEGLPVTLVEAQASGLKVLASDSITKEVDLTDLIEYFSLSETAQDWADKISMASDNREKYSQMIAQSGFGIQEELRIIENIYTFNM